MQIVMQLSNGAYVYGDEKTRAQMRSEGATDEQIEEAFDAIEDMLKEFSKLTYLSLEIEGQERIFNPAHVMWVDFNRDD